MLLPMQFGVNVVVLAVVDVLVHVQVAAVVAVVMDVVVDVVVVVVKFVKPDPNSIGNRICHLIYLPQLT